MLHSDGKTLFFTNVKGPVRDLFTKYGWLKKGHQDDFYLSNLDAVKDVLYDSGKEFEEYVSQSKEKSK